VGERRVRNSSGFAIGQWSADDRQIWACIRSHAW